MRVEQLPAAAGEFARYLRDLTSLLDQGSGWCGVFWQRDPRGMRACLDGHEVPPWDVVESLLQDLAGRHGAQFAEHEAVRAGRLHAAAAAVHDRLSGGAASLRDRLETVISERTYAEERQRELAARLRVTAVGADAESLGHELAWAQDDVERATARCEEFRTRLAALTPAPGTPGRPVAPESWFRAPGAEGPAGHAYPQAASTPEGAGVQHTGPGAGHTGRPAPAAPASAPGDDPGPAAGWDAEAEGSVGPVPVPGPGPAPSRKRRSRGARFAGLDDEVDVQVAPAPPTPATPAGSAFTPRGARYRGLGSGPGHPARTGAHAGVRAGAQTREEAEPQGTAEARRAAASVVAELIALRAGGRSGEAHVVLCQAAMWPPARLPVLAAELHRADLAADWATLLWEAASLPPDRLAATAEALAAAGRDGDCGQLLRQGVSRPAPEIADAALALAGAGREREARALLDAFVRVHTPEEAAQIAQSDPRWLVPQLLAAADAVSDSCRRDLLHALRVAGVATG
ncbi:hypothetical protein [Streptomyces sp. NPDC051219]|uniref:hypothetical protein n=1 Tax=Streptomyces sp. NPDC051219 TaxID=3155283 RepID=UPI00342316B6